MFVSLGMLVLDELHLPDGTFQYDVIGGSGAYSTLGARLAVDRKQSPRIKSFILAGEDFPYEKVETQFRSWGIDYVIKKQSGVLSTKGRLQYHDWKFERKSLQGFGSRLLTNRPPYREVVLIPHDAPPTTPQRPPFPIPEILRLPSPLQPRRPLNSTLRMTH